MRSTCASNTRHQHALNTLSACDSSVGQWSPGKEPAVCSSQESQGLPLTIQPYE